MLTAQKAREIVNHSKIFEKIEHEASKGNLELTLDYMTPDIFKSLTDNGFKIFLTYADLEHEATQYNEALFNQYKHVVISWER